MEETKKYLKNLINSVESSYNIFLESYDKQTIGPATSDYKFRYSAFIVVCHASIEEYMEEIATHALKLFFNAYQKCNIATCPIVQLALSYPPPSKRECSIHTCYSLFREQIKKNHGIKKEHLEKILNLFSINLELVEESDWTSLCHERGSFAHNSPLAITKFRGPKDVKVQLETCLDFCKGINAKIITLLNELQLNITAYETYSSRQTQAYQLEERGVI